MRIAAGLEIVAFATAMIITFASSAGAQSGAARQSRTEARKACCAEIGGAWRANTDGTANGTCYPSGPQAPFYQCMREKGYN